jgi:hypothetical protein
MKNSILVTVLVCVLSITSATWGLSTIPTIIIDENGNGTYNGQTLDYVYVQNQSLYYILPFVTSPGDVAIREPGTQELSDLLRFAPIAGAPITYLFVYSELPEAGETPAMADLGVPAVGTTVLYFDESGTEGGKQGLYYVPSSPNDPGAVPTNGIAYDFTSDVPEPTTMALLAMGGAAILRRRR